VILGIATAFQSAHATSQHEAPGHTRAKTAEKKPQVPNEQEKTTAREIYSAMEPEPGPGSKPLKKLALKQIDSFDPVPKAQREPITRRLRLIERLVLEYGRAYDYRAVTIAELTAILTSLEKSGANQDLRQVAEPQGSEFGLSETPPDPPTKKIHLPELNPSRPIAPAEDTEIGGPQPEASETTDPSHVK
jgi:hypothetical protein